MLKSLCVCTQNSSFIPYITYQNETVFAHYNGITIARCKNCGLLKTFSKNIKPQTSNSKTYEDKKENYAKLFQPILETIKNSKKNGSILDVGCSSGILLELLQKQGYTVNGVEPNADAYKIAYSKFKDKIFNGTLTDFTKVNKKTFDVVIYNHVLEHIPNPAEEINNVKKLLKKNGVLIIGVPNTDNVIFYLRKKYWESLLPDQHIWHFSTNYLKRFLKENGFEVVEKSYSNYEREDYPVLKRIYFSLLVLINKILGTGEAVLLTYERISTD